MLSSMLACLLLVHKKCSGIKGLLGKVHLYVNAILTNPVVTLYVMMNEE